MTALCLAVLVSAAALALRSAAAGGIRAEVDQRASDVASFAAQAADPVTGQPFASAQHFIEAYLGGQQPAPGVVVAGTVDASERLVEVTGSDAPSLADLDATTRARLLGVGSAGTTSAPGVGAVSWRNVEVHAGDTFGFVTIAVFHEARSSTGDAVARIVLLAAIALVATTVAAWWGSRSGPNGRPGEPHGRSHRPRE